MEPIGETSSHATRQVNVCPRSSRLAEPLWPDPALKSGTGMRDLHLHFKNKKQKQKAQAGSESSNYPTRALYARKKQPPPPKSPPTPAPLFTMRFAFSAIHHTTTTSEVLRTQKLRSSLLKTQNYQRLSFKPGVGQNIAFYASPAARNAILLMSIFPVHVNFFFFQMFSPVCLCLRQG